MDRPDPDRVDAEFDLSEYTDEMDDLEYDNWDPTEEMSLMAGDLIGDPDDESDVVKVVSRHASLRVTDPLDPNSGTWEVDPYCLYEEWRQGELVPKAVNVVEIDA